MSQAEADVINNVADVLEKYGWVQRILGNTGLGFCIQGAFNHVWVEKKSNSDAELEAHVRAGKAVSLKLRKQFVIPNARSPITFYNDLIAKDAQQVLDKLRSIAKEEAK